MTGQLFTVSHGAKVKVTARATVEVPALVELPGADASRHSVPQFTASTLLSLRRPAVGSARVYERSYFTQGQVPHLGTSDDVVVMDMVTLYTDQEAAEDEYYSVYYYVGAAQFPPAVNDSV